MRVKVKVLLNVMPSTVTTSTLVKPMRGGGTLSRSAFEKQIAISQHFEILCSFQENYQNSQPVLLSRCRLFI